MTTNIYAMSDTWNSGATTFDAIAMDVTDTSSASASRLLSLTVSTANRFAVRKDGLVTQAVTSASFSFGTTGVAGQWGIGETGGMFIAIDTGQNIKIGGGATVGFLSGGFGSSLDVAFIRRAAGIFAFTNGSSGGAAYELTEQTAPAAGAANTVRVYAQDNGAGKTQLMALFNSGAAQQIAIEP